ncbi:MAG TPA: lysylphosphatidylglycerol synthase transmembrane domain-containing protein [Vicinamibacterales bacterium]
MIVRLAITAAILAYLATRIDMAASARAVTEVSLQHLILVLVMVGIDRAVMILRWILLLRGSGINISTGDATRLFLVSSFVGSFLPAGIGADAARAYGLTRVRPEDTTPQPHASVEPQATASEALASVAVDRLLGVASLVLMAIIGVIAWTPEEPGDWRIPAAILVALIACVAVFWADEWLRLVIPTRRHGGFVTRRLLRLTDAVGRYRNRRSVLVHVLVWSLLVQVLRITQAYVLAVGLGITVPFTYFLLFMPLGLLLLLLPISISGFGAPQAGIVWLLRPMSVADADAFALSTLIVLTGLAGNLPGLVLWLRRRQT